MGSNPTGCREVRDFQGGLPMGLPWIKKIFAIFFAIF
jgi:hypothetical protein